MYAGKSMLIRQMIDKKCYRIWPSEPIVAPAVWSSHAKFVSLLIAKQYVHDAMAAVWLFDAVLHECAYSQSAQCAGEVSHFQDDILPSKFLQIGH